jgi:hypothetical protein
MTSKAIIQTALGPRLARVEEKLDAYIEGKGAAAAAPNPTPPRSPLDEALDASLDHLALKLGSSEWLLPEALTIHRELDLDSGEERAIAVSCNGVKWSLREAYDLGILALDSRVSQDRLAIVVQFAHAHGWQTPRDEAIAKQALAQIRYPERWRMR